MYFIKWMGHYRAQMIAVFASGFKAVSYVIILTYIMVAQNPVSRGIIETVALVETMRVSLFYGFIFAVTYCTEFHASVVRMQVS